MLGADFPRRRVDEATLQALAAAVAAHTTLRELTLRLAPLHPFAPTSLDAVVQAALAARVRSLALLDCGLSWVSAPALARLLRSDTLMRLELEGLEDIAGPAAETLAAALSTNRTLRSLSRMRASVFSEPSACSALLTALTGHCSLQSLCLRNNRAVFQPLFGTDATSYGVALGGLIAANAPTLTHLDCGICYLRDGGLGQLFAALPQNKYLRSLDCSGNIVSEAFARDVILPAVRANASLQRLTLESWEEPGCAHTAEAAALVQSRALAPS